MSDKQKEYLTTKQAAEMLGVAVSTIQQWANEGLLKAWTTGGGHRRIIRSSIDEMLSQRLAAEEETTSEMLSQQPSIVIVEDNPQQIRMYVKQFRRWHKGINIVTANDGYEGLIKIGQTLPSVIITDLRMPNMDGFQMIKALKKMPELSECVIVVVTGLTVEEVQQQGGLPDDVELFIKPVAFEKLEKILRSKFLDAVA